MENQLTNFDQIDFDRKLIAQLPNSGPRYTSYPTADRFDSTFNYLTYIKYLENLNTDKNNALSLYVHIPFCNVICYYCGCNKIVTKDKSKSNLYIYYLSKELALLKKYLKNKYQLKQLHFGGGTPTFLTNEQLSNIFENINNTFELLKDGEYSIEIDPRKVNKDTVFHLAKLGFNRMSVGIQDFNPKVQQAINRIQSEEETKEVIDAARDFGFKSVSIDLIYGLPFQTVASVEESLKKVLALSPDRISFYHYAHLPHIFKPQRRIDTNVIPNSKEKLDILQNTVKVLTDVGYIFIGMDHFAKPSDELSIALKNGKLQRNFQGYSTHAECDLIGIGVSSIGKIGKSYSQNYKNIDEYYLAIDEEKLPILRGLELKEEDILRQEIIQNLMCKFIVNIKFFENKYNINFQKYFKSELIKVKKFEKLGLTHLDDNAIYITNKGRFLIRNIAMIFDYYLNNKVTQSSYSKTI